MSAARLAAHEGGARCTPEFFYRGRVALHAILRALGLGPGSTVVVQAFTCTAVPEAILALGARPMYVDIEPDGVNMSPSALERALGSGADAVVLQHTFGVPADVERVSAICGARGVRLVEDCCHILGFPQGMGPGSTGMASFFSFEWGKPIPVGIGGAAIANSPGLGEKLHLAAQGLTAPPLARTARLEIQYWLFRLLYSPARYWMVRRAFRRLSRMRVAEGNYHLAASDGPSPEFGWTISIPVRGRVRKAETNLGERSGHVRSVVARYRDGITSPGLRHLVDRGSGDLPILARYPLLAERKADLLRAAEAANVEVAGWYSTPVHPLEGEELRSVGYTPGSCPGAETAARHVVTLPIHRVRERDVEKTLRFLNGGW